MEAISNTVRKETTLILTPNEKMVLEKVLQKELIEAKGMLAIFSKGDSQPYANNVNAIKSMMKKLK